MTSHAHNWKFIVQPGTVHGPTEYFEVCDACGMEKTGSDIDIPECDFNDDCEEPTGSCEECGIDVFEGDMFCEQCDYRRWISEE